MLYRYLLIPETIYEGVSRSCLPMEAGALRETLIPEEEVKRLTPSLSVDHYRKQDLVQELPDNTGTTLEIWKNL